MKALKLNHDFAEQVAAGTKSSTIRINDDKNLSVDDQVELIDKVDPDNPDSWQAIGTATINEIIEKRLSDLTAHDLEGDEAYASSEEMYEAYRRYYGPSVSPQTPAKVIRFSFTPHKKPQRVAAVPTAMINKPEIVKLFADGGSRGNPGPSASGYVLLDQSDTVIKKSGEYLGITTNNQAEYQALRLGLEEAQKLGAREVDVYMDSLLVVNQMKGIFKVRNRDLWPIHEAIKEQAKFFKKVTYSHVPRELNKLADAEVNEVLDVEAIRNS